MAAHADDLRYFYAESLGRTIAITATAATSIEIVEPLEPGRYIVRILDYDGGSAVWVRQGVHGSNTAAASEPSTQFLAHTDTALLNLPVFTLMVRATAKTSLAFFSVGGNAAVQITKISRDLG